MPGFHFASNGRRTILSQRAAVLQPASDGKHPLLAGRVGTSSPAGSRGKIVPIHATEPLTLGTAIPSLHNAQGDPEASRYRTPRSSTSHRGDDLPSLFGRDVFEPLNSENLLRLPAFGTNRRKEP